jgi:hypothetical protein
MKTRPMYLWHINDHQYLPNHVFTITCRTKNPPPPPPSPYPLAPYPRIYQHYETVTGPARLLLYGMTKLDK